MEILYRLGNASIFRNLRYVLIIFLVILALALIFKIKKIIDNYNYINREISVLENIESLTQEEFIEWNYEFLLSKGICINEKISKDLYVANSEEGKKLIYITRDYSILDKIDAKKMYGFSLAMSCNNIVIVTTSNIDKSFLIFANNKNLKLDKFERSDFKISYKDFIMAQSGAI